MTELTRLNRRSFLGRVLGAGAALGVGAAVLSPAAAQVTDRDAGATADPAGRGRGSARTTRTGITDSDQGATADQRGYGRNPVAAGASRITDADSGPSADRAGYGRGTTPNMGPPPQTWRPPAPPAPPEAQRCTGAPLSNGIRCERTIIGARFHGGYFRVDGRAIPPEYYNFRPQTGGQLELSESIDTRILNGTHAIQGCVRTTFSSNCGSWATFQIREWDPGSY